MRTLLLLFAILLLSVISLSAQSYKINMKKYEVTDSIKRYDIHLEYPEISGYPDAEAQEIFNKQVYTDIMNTKDEFLNEAAPENLFSPDMLNELWAGYDEVFKNNEIISIVGTNYFYTGGAHGMQLVYPLNYDLKNKKFLELTDVFEGKYLDFLSEFSRKQLTKDLEEADAEWIKGGTTPDVENFDCFVFNKDTVTITFQSYQVAAYVFGQPEVKILWKDLMPYIKKESIVRGLFKKD